MLLHLIDVSFSKFQPHVVHMLIFVILIRHINTKLLKRCSESQKLLKVAKIGKSSKVAQKLPSTICLDLTSAIWRIFVELNNPKRALSKMNFTSMDRWR